MKTKNLGPANRKWFYFKLICVALVFSACSEADNSAQPDLNTLVGKTIIERELVRSHVNDIDAFGLDKVLGDIIAEYKTAAPHLTDDEKLNYFWVLIWHLDFNGYHQVDEFLTLAYAECGEAFELRLSNFIEISEKLNRDQNRLQLAKSYHSHLNDIRNR